jgi:hypothetical protein
MTDNGDNGRASRELAISVLLHEYDALRDEIVSRTTSRFNLVGLAAVAATIVTAKSSTHHGIWWIIGWTAGITFLVGIPIWLLFGTYINRCAGRLMQIEYELNYALGCSVLVWESYRLGWYLATNRKRARNNLEEKLATARKCGELERPCIAAPRH